MTRQMRQHAFAPLTALMALSVVGCDLAVPYKAPVFGFPQGYQDRHDRIPVTLNDVAWWQGLDDPDLDALIARALGQNLTLEVARERVIAARASRATIPGLVGGSSSLQAGVEGNVSGSSRAEASAQVGLSWILDPYGTRRDELRAADARVDIADAEVDAARLLAIFNVTDAYARLRHDQAVRAQAMTELRGRQDTLDLTRTLVAAESATRLETTRSEARVAELRSRLPQFEAAILADLHEISVLVGDVPGTLPEPLRTRLSQPAAQPVPRMSPDIGIPADLLRNRPDIVIAERNHYAAIADIGIARAAQYPQLSLSGSISVNAVERDDSGADYFFGPLIRFPVLSQDETRAAVELRDSRARQAHTIWVATVTDAILEVENALVQYRATSRSLQSARDASRLYEEAATLTLQIFERSEATFGDWIDAQQAVSTANRTLAELRLELALRYAALNVSLGAGHDVAIVPPPG